MQEEWLSITEAAARLTASGDAVDRSTLSRYLKQHAEALTLKPDGKSNLVELGALIAHRKENIRIRPSSPAGPAVRRSAVLGRTEDLTQANAASRDKMAVAEMREMDLWERRRELTPVNEVDQAGRNAVALMQSAFDRAIETEAASLSLKYGWDERTLRVALKNFSRAGVGVFNREVLKFLDGVRRQEVADEQAPLPAADGYALQ